MLRLITRGVRLWFVSLLGLGILLCHVTARAEGGPWHPSAGEAYQETFGMDPKTPPTAWLADDDEFFYFAACVTDTTPDDGMLRCETRNPDADFYPAVSYTKQRYAENFSARWTGQIAVPKSGEWTFTLAADDGARLNLDGKLVIVRTATERVTECAIPWRELLGQVAPCTRWGTG